MPSDLKNEAAQAHLVKFLLRDLHTHTPKKKKRRQEERPIILRDGASERKHKHGEKAAKAK
jgi:hypothetical protein